MRKIFWWVLFALAVPGVSWAQTDSVVVYFNPSSTTVTVGQIFTVDIVADIPAGLSVLGWGLDVNFDSTRLARTGVLVNDPPWAAVDAGDHDDLAALALPPVLSGPLGLEVVLATLTFRALAAGTSPLVASVTAGDDTEGFALDPSGFANVSFVDGRVTVQPAGPPVGAPAVSPLGLVILTGLLGLVGVGMRRRKG